MSESYIYEYFGNIQNKVDLRIEIIKNSIENLHEEMTNKISDLRDKCIEKFKSETENLIENEPVTLNVDLKQFSTNNERWNEINNKIENMLKEICKTINQTELELIECDEIEIQNSKKRIFTKKNRPNTL